MTTSTFGDTTAAKVNGTTLAYREHGEGEPVVFVHGSSSDLRTLSETPGAPSSAYSLPCNIRMSFAHL
jgi:pimeloyl-ACP methyl ester carboxylesterase